MSPVRSRSPALSWLSRSSFLAERERDGLVQCQVVPRLPLRTEPFAEPLMGCLCSRLHEGKRVALELLSSLFGDRLGRREQSCRRAGIGFHAKAPERGKRFGGHRHGL